MKRKDLRKFYIPHNQGDLSGGSHRSPRMDAWMYKLGKAMDLEEGGCIWEEALYLKLANPVNQWVDVLGKRMDVLQLTPGCGAWTIEKRAAICDEMRMDRQGTKTGIEQFFIPDHVNSEIERKCRTFKFRCSEKRITFGRHRNMAVIKTYGDGVRLKWE